MRPISCLLLLRSFSACALVALATGIAGCGDAQNTAPLLPPLSAVVLTPVTDTLQVGQSRVFVATAYDTSGAPVAGAGFTWTSSDPAVFTVTNSGRVTALAEGLALLIASAGGKADTSIVFVYAQNGWAVQTSNTAANLNGVYFLSDGRKGFAVGDGGTVRATTDAGITWVTRVSSTAFNLNDVWFPSASLGFAVGHSGTVMRTTNGGITWTRLSNLGTGSNLYGVWFTDTAHGWAVGASGTIAKTIDGGNSWTLRNPTASQLNSVSFSDTLNGWAVGEGGTIVGTHDGGASWYVVQPAVTATALKSVWRSSNTAAWAVGPGGTMASTSATVDSLQWNLSNIGASYALEGLHVASALTAYAVGANGSGLILKTIDGGISWSPQTANSAQALNDVWFVDTQRGWAVGAGGRIVHTSRGGQ
ncbi:MAG: YCF48-related protein [Candidatus Eisenbacteria bacterium]